MDKSGQKYSEGRHNPAKARPAPFSRLSAGIDWTGGRGYLYDTFFTF
jgi:hypothetical protein